MPCDGSYMDPNDWERNSHKVCKHLKFIFDKLKDEKKLPRKLAAALLCDDRALVEAIDKGAKDPYGCLNTPYALDEQVAKLCSILSNMTPKMLDKYVYDGRNKQSRELANWWEEHQEADQDRVKEEQRQIAKKKREVTQTAALTYGLKKLSSKELRLLQLCLTGKQKLIGDVVTSLVKNLKTETGSARKKHV